MCVFKKIAVSFHKVIKTSYPYDLLQGNVQQVVQVHKLPVRDKNIPSKKQMRLHLSLNLE